jgi:hypothetical protein
LSQVEEYLQKVASLPKLAFDTNLGTSPSFRGKVSTNREIEREREGQKKERDERKREMRR